MQLIDTLVLSCVAGTGALAAYCAVIYPAILSLLARYRRRPWVQRPIQPRVSVIIPARNEAGVIGQKIKNVLAADYPDNLFEIVVVSDCSSDETDSIVESFAPRVTLVRAATRSGKQVCLNLAAAQSAGEILLFTDAASLVPPHAISLLVRHFADPSIGAVSSAIRIGQDPTSATSATSAANPAPNGKLRQAQPEGEGLYLGADCAVRTREGEISSIVGCVGACYAMRRSCFAPFDPGDCDDFASVYNVVAAGQRAVMDPEVICEMLPARDARVEMTRKVRTIAGALDTVWRYRRTIFKFAPSSLLWFLISHKVCRWMLPLSVLLSATAIAVGAAYGHSLWRIPLAGVAIVAVAALTAQRSSELVRRFRLLKPLAFLGISITAGIVAWATVITGRKQIIWQPTPRTPGNAC